MLAAGQADGAVIETLAVMFFNKEKVQMQVVRFAHKATPESGHFFILASGQSGVTEPSGLRDVKIGISQGTIIEYVTDRLLQAEGFSPDEIQYVAVPKIPDRINLLQSGELEAGVMPDPAAALAVMQGASLVLDDRAYPEYGASVISFRKEVIDQHPETVRAFLAAIEQAVVSINSNPAKYASLLSEKQLIPPPLLGTFQVPQFPTAGVPAKPDWDDALAWAKDKGLLDVDVSYADSVNGSLLP
jgi:NitT/TauT family transport system substrate-binding protein